MDFINEKKKKHSLAVSVLKQILDPDVKINACLHKKVYHKKKKKKKKKKRNPF